MTLTEKVLTRYKTAARQPGKVKPLPEPWAVSKAQDAKAEFSQPEGTDLSIWEYQLVGKYYLYYTVGMSAKPEHLSFSSEHRAAKHYFDLVTANKAYFERQRAEAAEKAQFKTSIVAGDIFYTSWGYDQTNVDFYQVTAIIGSQMVKVREVGKKIVKSDGYSEEVVPASDHFVGSEKRIRVQMGDRAKIDGHYASKWSGGPVHQSGPYGGH